LPCAQANLARYISDEAQHKRSTALDVSDWQRSAPSDIPEQMNGCDCGVFMLKYADWLVRDRAAEDLLAASKALTTAWVCFCAGTASGFLLLAARHALLPRAHRCRGALDIATEPRERCCAHACPSRRSRVLARAQVRQKLAV
jgi:hypothetical protein